MLNGSLQGEYFRGDEQVRDNTDDYEPDDGLPRSLQNCRKDNDADENSDKGEDGRLALEKFSRHGVFTQDHGLQGNFVHNARSSSFRLSLIRYARGVQDGLGWGAVDSLSRLHKFKDGFHYCIWPLDTEEDHV